MEEWPNFPDDYLEYRKHDIHVHLQILNREIEEIHQYLVHYQEPWISEGQLRKAIATWKKEDPGKWRTAEDLHTRNMIEAMRSPGRTPDQAGPAVVQTIQTVHTAVDDHKMQKTLRKNHIGLSRTMSSSANKNNQNQASSVPRSLSLKKTLRQSILSTAADFKSNISPDLIKSQFARQDFANKTHYKSPELLSPGHKRSNTSLSPITSPTFSEKGENSPRHSRSNTEQIVSAKTTFARSGPVSPGQQISDELKNQFAAMSTHYKDPGLLSPPSSRENTMISRPPLDSPSIEQNGKTSPYFSGSNTSSPRHTPKFSWDQAIPEDVESENGYRSQNGKESPVIPPFAIDTRPISTFPTVPPSNPSAAEKPYVQIARGTPELVRKPSYDQNKGTTPSLVKKPSFDQIGRGVSPIATILPGPDGRYRPDGTKSPEPQTNRNNIYPTRTSSLARKGVNAPRKIPSSPASTDYFPPPPPPLKENPNAKFVPQDSYANVSSSPQNTDYRQPDAYDARSQYSQNPSQIRGNNEPQNFAMGAYPTPTGLPLTYMDTTKSSASATTVPIAMYPNTPEANTPLKLVEPYPSANTAYNQSSSNNSQSQHDQKQKPYDSDEDGFDIISAYEESVYDDDRSQVPSEAHQSQIGTQRLLRSQSSASTVSQRVARRVTVWDGANGFTDPGSMPIIEESPGEWERDKEKEREERMAREKSFDFSGFLADLTKVSKFDE